MKKKNIIIILAVLIAVALLLLFTGNNVEDIDLSLGDLKSNGEYQYSGIAWGASVAQVNEALPYALEQDSSRTPPISTGYTFYKSQNAYTLDGQSTVASVQFHDGTLQVIQFAFHVGQNYQQWFESQVAELSRLYGAHTDKVENASDIYESTVYTWSTDNSMLQIVLLTGKYINPTVTISVGMK
ncbi:MAG: hypothetical protein IKC95_04445 [Oscillospiraceae bacterium]|nr:hypothetical protein [Oscillospiraceae bacterium]